MPVQRTVLGKPVSLRSLPRRFIIAFALATTLLLFFIISIPSSKSLPTRPRVVDVSDSALRTTSRPRLPKIYNPFGTAAHEPPQQENSTSGDTKWYSDLKWLNPFSSLVTLDEDRAVLPPLPIRPHIYTYYDSEEKKDPEVAEAENALLLTWRRAWWAAGFRPVVLGRPEAMRNPLYAQVQPLLIDPTLKGEIERWLAWGHMQGGILANWLALPMGKHDDLMLQYLRRGEFSLLTRYQGLKTGLFVGREKDINKAIKAILNVPNLQDMTSMIQAIPNKLINLDNQHDSIALYDMSTLSTKYPLVADKLSADHAQGLRSLQELINAHLHLTWQDSYPDGIATIKPHSPHMAPLTTNTQDIARLLVQCPVTPIPSSCPPNRKTCTSCNAENHVKITTPENFRNSSRIFTIGTFPHPYTYNTLHYQKEVLDVKFIRRTTFRDRWLGTTTQEILGSEISGPQRLVTFKEIVASSSTARNSLWLTSESEDPIKLDWIFGFSLPSGEVVKGSKKDGSAATSISQSEVTRSKNLMEHSKEILSSKKKNDRLDVEMVEAWNLADTEAWRFVRAYTARRRVERLKWEEDEQKFAGAERRGKWFED